MRLSRHVRWVGALSMLLLLADAGSALAHHSFAMFDHSRTPGYTLLEYVCEDNREYADEHGLQKTRLDP
jgi:hypothetical protein